MRRALALLLLLVLPPLAASAASAPSEPGAPGAPVAELDALLARIARPAPAVTAYAEVRWSPLLTQPVVSEGELEYRGPGELAKRVAKPFRETTEVRGDDVRVQREGERPRRFSLARAPELRGLLASFGALLAGDRAALERLYDVTLSGDGAHWRVELAPRDARLRARVRGLTVYGREDAPRCLAVAQADGSSSWLLFADAAAERLPVPLAPETLAARCGARSR